MVEPVSKGQIPGAGAASAEAARQQAGKTRINLGGELSTFSPAEQEKVRAWLMGVISKCSQIPKDPKDHDYSEDVLNQIISNNFTIDMSHAGSFEDYYSIIVLGALTRYAGMNMGILDDKAMTLKEVVDEARKKIREFQYILYRGDAEASDVLTPKLQADLIKYCYGEKLKLDAGMHVNSNLLPKEFVSAAMKIALLRLSEKNVTGVREVSENNFAITDSSLSVENIKSIACRFMGSIEIDIHDPKVKKTVVDVLLRLYQTAEGDDKVTLGKLINELSRSKDLTAEEELTNENRLTDKDIRTIFAMRARLQQSQGDSPEDKEIKEAADIMTLIRMKTRRKPGLPPEDVAKLVWLVNAMANDPNCPTSIILGVTQAGSGQEELRQALDILNRLGHDITAMAAFAPKKIEMGKGVLGFIVSFGKELAKTTSEDMVTAMQSRGDQEFASAGVPQGYVSALKYRLLGKTYVWELDRLGKILFDPRNERLFAVVDKINDLDEKHAILLGKYRRKELSLEKAGEQEELIISERNVAEAERKRLVALYTPEEQAGLEDFSANYQRYEWIINYLNSDEIDAEFLEAFKKEFGDLISTPLEGLVDPYSGDTVEASAEDLIWKRGGEDSFINRFKKGESWTSLDICMGEGRREDNVILAKSALQKVISSLYLTEQRLNANVLPYLSTVVIENGRIGAAVQVGSLVAPKKWVNFGAVTWDDLKSPSYLSRAANHLHERSGRQWNSNEGLMLKQLLVMRGGRPFDEKHKAINKKYENLPDPKPHEILAAIYGDDPVQHRNLIDAGTIDIAINFLINTYIEINNNVMTDPGKRLKFEREMKRLGLKYLTAYDYRDALEELMALRSVLQGLSFNLQDKTMPLRLFEVKGETHTLVVLGKGEEGRQKTIEEGAEFLRNFLSEAYKLMGAYGEADQDNANLRKDPVANIFLGSKEGTSMEYVVTDKRTGELKDYRVYTDPEYENASFAKKAVRFISDVGRYSWAMGRSFGVEMPIIDINSGFFQTFGFGLESNKLQRWALNKLGLNTSKFTYAQEMWDSFLQGAVSTSSIFLHFFYNPIFIVGPYGHRFARNYKNDTTYNIEWARSSAALLVQGPFAYSAARNLATIPRFAISQTAGRWVYGLRPMSFTEFAAQQDVILGTPLRTIATLGRAAGNIDYIPNTALWLSRFSSEHQMLGRLMPSAVGSGSRDFVKWWITHVRAPLRERAVNIALRQGKAAEVFYRESLVGRSIIAAREGMGGLAGKVPGPVRFLYGDVLTWGMFNKLLDAAVANPLSWAATQGRSWVLRTTGMTSEQLVAAARTRVAGDFERVLRDEVEKAFGQFKGLPGFDKQVNEAVASIMEDIMPAQRFTRPGERLINRAMSAGVKARNSIRSIADSVAQMEKRHFNLLQKLEARIAELRRSAPRADIETLISGDATAKNLRLRVIRMENGIFRMMRGRVSAIFGGGNPTWQIYLQEALNKISPRFQTAMLGGQAASLTQLPKAAVPPSPGPRPAPAPGPRPAPAPAPAPGPRGLQPAYAEPALLPRDRLMQGRAPKGWSWDPVHEEFYKTASPTTRGSYKANGTFEIRFPKPQAGSVGSAAANDTEIFSSTVDLKTGKITERPAPAPRAPEAPAARPARPAAPKPVAPKAPAGAPASGVSAAEQKAAQEALAELQANPDLKSIFRKPVSQITKEELRRLFGYLVRLSPEKKNALMKALKAGGAKALPALKAFGAILVFVAPLIPVLMRWERVNSSNADVRAQAQVEILKDNTVGMYTGLVSMIMGAGGAVTTRVMGGEWGEGYTVASQYSQETMDGFLGWLDKWAQLGEGFRMEMKGVDWMFGHIVDPTLGKDGVGGWLATKFGGSKIGNRIMETKVGRWIF